MLTFVLMLRTSILTHNPRISIVILTLLVKVGIGLFSGILKRMLIPATCSHVGMTSYSSAEEKDFFLQNMLFHGIRGCLSIVAIHILPCVLGLHYVPRHDWHVPLIPRYLDLSYLTYFGQDMGIFALLHGCLHMHTYYNHDQDARSLFVFICMCLSDLTHS